MAFPFGTPWWMQPGSDKPPGRLGRFVAVGSGGAIITSPNAVDWTQKIMGGAPLNAIAYGDGLFIAVGNNGTVCRSEDGGETWSSSNITTPALNDVIFVDGTFLSCSGNTPGIGARIFLSSDGAQWVEAFTPSTVNLTSMAYGDGIYVATGNNRIIYSQDGINWELVSGSYLNVSSVAYGNGRFLSVRDQAINSNYISFDGINWGSISNAGGGSIGRLFTVFENDIFIAGTSGGGLLRGMPPENWRSSFPAVPGVTDGYRDGVYGGGQFVVVGDNARIITSEDGLTWSLRPPPAGFTDWLRGVAYGEFSDASD